MKKGTLQTVLVLAAASSSLAAVAQSEQQRSTKSARETVTFEEEVIVTAQKREERLQDVPISISVLDGAELDEFTGQGVSEALTLVPGVATTAAFQGGGTQLAVRGVSAGSPLFSGSSPIAYYLDSVSFGLIKTAMTPDSNAYDLDRIEVLRGPQGTLYGASAQNGVVRILTKDPTLDKFELKARTSLSSTEDGSESYRGDMAVNLPIVDGKLAARFVAGYEDLSGWIDRPDAKDINDTRVSSFRFKIKAQPTDALAIGLSAWRSRADYGAPPFADENGVHTATLDESISDDYDLYGLTIGYDFSKFSLTSTSGYLDYDNAGWLDLLPLGAPDAPLFTGLKSHVFSQELTLNSTQLDNWRWTLGGMYRDGEDRLVQDAVFFPVPIDFSDTSKSFAVFGEVTSLLMDGRLELTAGLRYFEDDVTQIENVVQSLDPDAVAIRNNRTFDATSPRFVVTWHPTSDSTLYASYSEGFRSGFSQNANIIRDAPNFPALEADNLKNYEVGAKGSIAGGRFSYDTAVYYIDWQDVQQTINVDINGLPTTVLVNGESADGIGAEFAISAWLFDGLDVGVSFGWNDLTMNGDTFSEGVLLFAKGDRLNYSPEYTAGASANYAFPLGGSDLEGRFSLGANYASEQTERSINAGAQSIGIGDSILIGRASFSISAGNRWTGTLFVDNINDEEGAPIRTSLQVPDWSQRVRPRTIGLQLEYTF